MNDGLHKDSDDIPEHILEQAAIWQARLREVDDKSSAGRELKAEFNTWLLANPRHRQAMAEMDTLWAALEQPVARALAEASSKNDTQPVAAAPARTGVTTRFNSRALQRYAVAACLLLVMVSGIGWQQDWLTHWQSDYITAVGEQAPVALDDGTTITLNTQSAIAVDYSGTARRVRLLKGEAWFDVTDDPQRPFTVATERGEVRVTGTQFNVRQTADAAIVSLDQGRVELRSGNDRQQQTVALMPGQQAKLTATGISAADDFDRTAVTAWLRGQLVFYDTPLGKVVDTLNRYRQGRILITSDKLKRLPVSGVFSTSDPDAALALITDTLPVQQTRLTDYLVLLR